MRYEEQPLLKQELLLKQVLLSEQGLLPGQVPLLKQELLNPAEASASDPAEAPASAESGKSRSGRSLVRAMCYGRWW